MTQFLCFFFLLQVDSLKNILSEKEKLISNLQTEKQELSNTLNEVTSTLQVSIYFYFLEKENSFDVTINKFDLSK